MLTNVRDAIEAATAARRLADEKLEIAQRTALRSDSGLETVHALCALLRAQVSLSEALMQLCAVLALRCPESPPAAHGQALRQSLN